jgi:hypothetical protein
LTAEVGEGLLGADAVDDAPCRAAGALHTVRDDVLGDVVEPAASMIGAKELSVVETEVGRRATLVLNVNRVGPLS